MDSTSEQCKDVYAHFGAAMYLAQCVEQSITQLLIFFDFFPKQAPNWESQEKWELEYGNYESILSKKTMGRLIGSLKKLDNFKHLDDDLENLLATALDRRNWLAHAYFVDRGHHFINEAGRHEMVAELEQAQELFRSVENVLNPITYELTEKYGLTEAIIEEITEKVKGLDKADVTEEDYKEIIEGIRGNL